MIKNKKNFLENKIYIYNGTNNTQIRIKQNNINLIII